MDPKRIGAGQLATLVALLCASSAAWAQGTTVGNCLFMSDKTKNPPVPFKTNENLIIMPGSTSLVPVVQFLGAKLAKMTPPYRLVYFPMDSCTAMQLPLDKSRFSSAYGNFYEEDAAGHIVTSSCSSDSSLPIDMAIGDTFYDSCPLLSRDPLLGEFQGPQQAFVFVTPHTNLGSSSITAAEARTVFGCGAKGKVAPYLDDHFIYYYTDVATGGGFGAQTIAGKVINLVTFPRIQGTTYKGETSDDSLAVTLSGSTNPDMSIGFISAEVYDQSRDSLKALAFRGYNQLLAYLPDSDSNSRDKHNVRDGHYTFQAPVHLWVAKDAAGNIVKPLARKMVDWMQGNTVAPQDQLPFDIGEVYAQAGVVPQCAMKVQRYTDGGPLAPFVSDKPPCGCQFESQASGKAVPPGCVQCTDNSGCGKNQICSHNFCEFAW